jgi:hypothetical protein
MRTKPWGRNARPIKDFTSKALGKEQIEAITMKLAPL